MKNIYLKYQEIIFYLVVGGLTTIVNLIVYFVCKDLLFLDYKLSNILAWLISVLFAFIPNKYFVFQAKENERSTFFKELFLFLWYRLLSLGIDMVLMIILITGLGINDSISKIIVQVVVIILNYVFSKLFVFDKKVVEENNGEK